MNISSFRTFSALSESVAQFTMDNYGLSGDDYAQFKAGSKDAGWVDYLRERSRVGLTDYLAFADRLRATRAVRIRLDTPNPQAVLSAVPWPEYIKQLSLAWNQLEGGLDLSRFTQLEMLSLAGNPALDYSRLVLPPGLRHIIVSSAEQASLEKQGFRDKHPGISLSQNGNPSFTLGKAPFRAPEMIAVKDGTFWMGSEEGEAGASDAEKPRHLVQLSGYAIGKYLVTVKEFACFVEETGYVTAAEREGWSVAGIWRDGKLEFFCPAECNWRHDVYGQPLTNAHARHPVVHITWDDAMAYCEWLSRKAGKPYRLPTEAQWEYAAAGGHQAPKKDAQGYCQRAHAYAGSDDPAQVSWFFGQFEGQPFEQYGTRPVGQLQPNELGLHDMSGNVWEWCFDRHATDYYGQCEDAGIMQDPAGPEQGTNRMFRGGGWGRDAAAGRVANRRRSAPDDRGDAAGFRVACLE
ncbi:MAG: formylglycine-generating enzyme family protein [Phaeodactylibacter sp.]|nr:formylglycine-generating enzyme family protein [Phaeodactylibacter sp.]